MKRYLVDLKDVADRHVLYREEHAQEKELQLELLREKIRTAKEEAELRDGFKYCFYFHLRGNASVIRVNLWIEPKSQLKCLIQGGQGQVEDRDS